MRRDVVELRKLGDVWCRRCARSWSACRPAPPCGRSVCGAAGAFALAAAGADAAFAGAATDRARPRRSAAAPIRSPSGRAIAGWYDARPRPPPDTPARRCNARRLARRSAAAVARSAPGPPARCCAADRAGHLGLAARRKRTCRSGSFPSCKRRRRRRLQPTQTPAAEPRAQQLDNTRHGVPPVRNATIRRVNTWAVNKALSDYGSSTLINCAIPDN